MSRDWRGAVVTKIEHRYTEDLWLGLEQLAKGIEQQRKFLRDLLGSKRGIAMLQAVGAGERPLQLMKGGAK